MANRAAKEQLILTISSGKGGVGKSFLAVNIAVHLSRLGRKVILIDADLGGANLHSLLGLSFPPIPLSDFLFGKIEDIHLLLMESGVKGLQLLSSANDRVNIANLSYIEKLKLIKGLKSLQTDFLVIDTSTGSSYNSLDFFLLSPYGILITTPDPLSIENIYHYIKGVIIRKIKVSSKFPETEGIIKDCKALAPSPEDNLIERFLKIANLSGKGKVEKRVKTALADFKPKLIINQARSQEDRELGFSIQRMVAHYFGINMDYLGYVDEYQLVKDSILQRKPLLLTHPESRPAKCIENITNLLLANYIMEK